MSAEREMAEHFAEMIEPVGAVEVGRMFSGAGLAIDGVQFAMVIGGQLYMRVDDQSRPGYVDAGSEPFSYTARGREVVVGRYYSVPEEAAENREQLCELALESLAAAHRDDVRKKKR